MAGILVIEDEPALARSMAALLREAGHAVDTAPDGELALQILQTELFDLAILDLGLPGISGFKVLKALRARKSTLPVLILTARDTVSERVRGLDLGADDYLLKPFDTRELQARVRALLRRGHGDPAPVLVFGTLSVDRARGQAFVASRPLALRRREWAVLEGLLARPGELVLKERLITRVFGLEEDVSPNAIEVHVARLRKKLEPDGPTIRTLRGLGYILDIT